MEGATEIAGASRIGTETVVDLKALHVKIGALTLQNDFLSAALGKAGSPGAKR